MTSHAASSESTHESTLIALAAGGKPDKCELIASCQRALAALPSSHAEYLPTSAGN